MDRFRGVLLGIANALLCIQHSASFAVQQPILASSSVQHHATTVAGRASGSALVMLRSRGNQRRRDGSSRNRGGISRGAAAVTTLRISEEDRERDLKFERELDRDAQRWINGDAKRQELWNKAKSWRNLNKLLLAREEAMSELERETLRYFLKDVQTVTGLPLVEENEITPLAWFITLTIQLMPLAAIYIIVFSIATENNPQPVLDATHPFWA
ncbi:unnamed protein product [Ectocarpus sp. 12 AP-2014]